MKGKGKSMAVHTFGINDYRYNFQAQDLEDALEEVKRFLKTMAEECVSEGENEFEITLTYEKYEEE